MGPSGPAERMGKHASMRYIFVEIAASSGQDTAELTVPLRARHSLAHLPSKTAADSRPRLRPMVRLEHGSYRRQPSRGNAEHERSAHRAKISRYGFAVFLVGSATTGMS